MDFRYTPEEEAFRKEVREFLAKELPKDWPGVDPDLYHEDAFDNIHEVSVAMQKKLAAKGWLGLTWPKKYGGHEQPLWKQIILEEELTYRGSPGLDPYQFVGGMGDLLLDFGTEAQKEKYLPMMVRGEIKGATGMSEPNAGTDTLSSRVTVAIFRNAIWPFESSTPPCIVRPLSSTVASGSTLLMAAYAAARTGPYVSPVHDTIRPLLSSFSIAYTRTRPFRCSARAPTKRP